MSLVLMAGDISALSQLSLQGSASDRGMSPAHHGPGLHIMGAQHKYQLGNNFVVRGLFVTTTPWAITAILFSIKVYPFLCHYSRNKDKEQ